MPSACNRSQFGRAGGSQTGRFVCPARADLAAAKATQREGVRFIVMERFIASAALPKFAT
jgi:hypothetical protein